MSTLVVIPTLNEAAHIGRVLDRLLPFLHRQDAILVVADGGSTDSTCQIVRDRAETEPGLRLLQNPQRYQSAAINLAVERYGADCQYLIRIDAHSDYPEGYCDVLLAEAERTGADSVVVSMVAIGQTPSQRMVAAAQNSRFGNGGSAHRNRTDGEWVDHGHHALMRITAFRAVGGYDASFSHNEDAELDHRLRAAGYRIWLTAATHVDYYPRSTVRGLFRQYFAFGRGRARNLAKHHSRPALRQWIAAAIGPALMLIALAGLSPVFALPFLGWLALCFYSGLRSVVTSGESATLLSGLAAGVMQVAWSAGFWTQRLGLGRVTP